MYMQITTVQWNIGGGKISDLTSDDNLSYTKDGLDYICKFLHSVDADIITLQEVHSDDTLNQAEYLAAQLGMNYYISDFYDDSHIEEGQKLGQAVISKFPISSKVFQFYINPHKETTSDDGLTIWHSHDKGCTRCTVNLGDVDLGVATTHLVPFRKFGIDTDSAEGKSLLGDIESKLVTSTAPQLIQGDFNLDMPLLAPVLTELSRQHFKEVKQDTPTTPKNKRYDHVVFKGMELIESTVIDTARTDHYPVVTKFESS